MFPLMKRLHYMKLLKNKFSYTINIRYKKHFIRLYDAKRMPQMYNVIVNKY